MNKIPMMTGVTVKNAYLSEGDLIQMDEKPYRLGAPTPSVIRLRPLVYISFGFDGWFVRTVAWLDGFWGRVWNR